MQILPKKMIILPKRLERYSTFTKTMPIPFEGFDFLLTFLLPIPPRSSLHPVAQMARFNPLSSELL